MIDPDTNQEIRLTGFNWTLKYTYKDEGKIMKDTLPGANVARIVGIFWKNTHDGKDCYQDQAPYFKESCFKELDYKIRRATDNGVWAIIAVRSAIGAGGTSEPNVFRDISL